jgi:CheY-like chemotaxis protein
MRDEVRLLLAEDDENDAIFLSRAFRKTGFPVPVERVADVVEAIHRLLDMELPRVTHLLMDLKMPLKSGLEVLEWLFGRGQGVRTAVLSASREEEEVRRAFELGAEFYLVKPTRAGDLAGLCRQLVDWVGHDTRPARSANVLHRRPG